jgi:putative addiction module component (TIGR02574 family)
MDITQLEAEVLALPSAARAALAQRLLLSLEDVSEAEFDQLWAEESLRRAAEFDAGRVQAISADEVARKARALLR